jgi:hypothetical protein
MHARTKTTLALGALALGVGYSVYKRRENPAWTPWGALLSSTRDKVLALEKVKITSVPTPHETAALDPGMSTDQVKQVNHALSNETDMKTLANHAVALSALGHDNSAAAVAAKTVAIGEAKAAGAKDADLHVKQVEAAAVPLPPTAIATGYFGRGGHGWGGGRGWGGRERGWDRFREPWAPPVVEEVIDPATGLPYAPVATGYDPRRGGRGGFEHRGFGRDPRVPHDRFGELFGRGRHEPWRREREFGAPMPLPEIPYDPWIHHRHRRHPLEEVVVDPALAQQQAYQAPVQQPVAQPAADDDAGADAATATGWW